MQAIYPCAQLICLICAIVFVGFLFFDAIIFSRAKEELRRLPAPRHLPLPSRQLQSNVMYLFLLAGGLLDMTLCIPQVRPEHPGLRVRQGYRRRTAGTWYRLGRRPLRISDRSFQARLV